MVTMSVMLPPIAVALRTAPSTAARLSLPVEGRGRADVAQDGGEVVVAVRGLNTAGGAQDDGEVVVAAEGHGPGDTLSV